jgi:signal transduction histidine kinase
MRRLLGVLRDLGEAPGHAPQPTIADLDDLLSTVRAAGLPTRLTVSGKPVAVPPSAQLAVYRMVQEALTNTLKHADATHAQVRLTYRGDTVELEVTDDGATPATGTDGHGIAGMRERAAVFDADVEVGPKTGGGWRVHTVLQLAGAVRAADSGAVRA